jgi:uncharacterized protein (TIGR00297 family)
MTNVVIGFTLAFIISGVAYARQRLRRSGAIAAVIIGTIIYASGGWLMMSMLLTFFITSNVIGRLFHIPKEPAQRNAKQVLANGLIATLLAVLYYATNDTQYLLLFGVSVAASTADTWSSELGVLSKTSPVSLVTLKPTTYGVSGSVTLIGLFASLVGAILISSFLRFHVAVIVFGFMGSIFDSLLGHFQVRYADPVTGDIVEDQDKKSTDHYHSGFRYLTNDMVNFVSNGVTVITAYLIL